jgi:hypothetical protein
MTDRELLELAAKAAGHGDVWSLDEHPDVTYIGPRYDGGTVRYRVWNPLTDDGDALRLAVKLRINIEHAEKLGRKSHGVNCWPVGRGDCGHMENDLRDYGAATRRAIVRAAAEIGREMK